MKKLALSIVSSACCACLYTLVNAQVPVAVHLNINDFGETRPSFVEIDMEVEGVAELDYLKIESANQFASVKLGYDENAVYQNSINLLNSTYQFMEMTLKDLNGTTDWSKIKVSLNDEYPGRVISVGNYLADAEYLEDGWFRVKIPVGDLQPIRITSHITFPHSFHVNIGVKEINFTGDTVFFNWFGSQKFDNAIKENKVGQSTRIFKTEGIVIDELRLLRLTLKTEEAQLTMPYHPVFNASLLQGENRLLGMVTDNLGNKYYSDTILLVIPERENWITYEATQVNCYGESGGSIDVSINGGVPPYTYIWSNGAGSQDITGLEAGTYHLIVTDSLGNSDYASMQIEQPDMLSAYMTAANCYDTTAFLNASGGRAPYQYSIEGGGFEPIGSNLKEDIWRVTTNQPFDESRYVNYAVRIEEDNLNNIYIAGSYGDELKFGKGSVGVNGEMGNYLVKLDPHGNFLWEFHTREIDFYFDNATVKDLSVDNNGTCRLVIRVGRDPVIIDDQILEAGLHVIHISPDGDLTDVKPQTGILKIDIDKSNNMYVSGYDYISKYSDDGSMVWSHQLQDLVDVCITDAGEVFIAGSFDDMILDGIKLTSRGRTDLFIAKLDTHGNVIWVKTGGSVKGYEKSWAIEVDSKGNLFVLAGFGAGNVVFDSFQSPIGVEVLIRLDASTGDLVWVRPYMKRGPQMFFEMGYDLAVNYDDQIFITTTGFDLILRPGEVFDTNEATNFLMQFDYTGALKSLQSIGHFQYDPDLINYPLVVTRDNHLVYTDYLNEFSIIKHGAPMKQAIDISSDPQEITIKDANGCLFLLDDLSYEEPAVIPPAICYVTSGTSGNKLFWTVTEKGESAMSYNIYRETFAVDEFEPIGSVNKDVFEFEDSVNVLERGYQYVVTAVDACGNESEYSDPHRTMHLTVNEGNLGQINLIWDGYHGLDYNSFKIYRGSSPAEMELLTSIPSYLYTYTDLEPSPFTLYYQIRVENDGSCSAGESLITQGRLAEGSNSREITSNIATNFGEAGNLTFYPNPAKDRIQVKFSPDGDEYQLKVIDAAGRLVRQVNGVYDQVVIEREGLPSGIYNVVLSKNSGKPLHGRIAFD